MTFQGESYPKQAPVPLFPPITTLDEWGEPTLQEGQDPEEVAIEALKCAATFNHYMEALANHFDDGATRDEVFVNAIYRRGLLKAAGYELAETRMFINFLGKVKIASKCNMPFIGGGAL